MSEAGLLIFCLFLQRRNATQESFNWAEAMASLFTTYQSIQRQGSSIQDEPDESGRPYGALDMRVTI
jgi:hypothetical protein